MYERKGGLAAVGPQGPTAPWTESVYQKTGGRVIALKGLQKPMIDGANTKENPESRGDSTGGSVIHRRRRCVFVFRRYHCRRPFSPMFIAPPFYPASDRVVWVSLPPQGFVLLQDAKAPRRGR